MANKPINHEYDDALDGKKKFRTLEELQRLEFLKQKDLKNTELWIQNEFGLDNYVNDVNSELYLFEHYKSMEGVEISPDIKDFWIEQKNSLSIDGIKAAQNEYMNAYKAWQDNRENMDSRKASELGIHNIDKQEADAHDSIKKAEESLRAAKERAKDAKDEVDPFKATIGFITGSNKDWRKERDAAKSVKDAKNGVKEAKLRLEAIKETRANLQQAKDKLTVKENTLLTTMSDAQWKMAKYQEKAEEIKNNSATVKENLHKQYALIDKYMAIQKFKNNVLKDSAAKAALDPSLIGSLESLPDNLPKKAFVISLTGPLKTIENTQTTDIENKITEIESKLPQDIDKGNLDSEITYLEINKDEKIADIENDMETIKNTKGEKCKEYQQLKLKKEHLELVQKRDNVEQEFKTLKNTIINSSSPTQAQLKELRNKQEQLKIIEDELKKDPYSQTLKNLKDLQKLLEEKEKASQEQNISPTNIDNIINELGTSNSNFNIDSQTTTIALYYFNLFKEVITEKNSHLTQLGEKNPDHLEVPENEHDDEER